MTASRDDNAPEGDSAPKKKGPAGDAFDLPGFKPKGDKPPFRSSRPRPDRPSFGGDKPRYGGGDKPRYGSRDGGGDRPRFGGGDKPRYGSRDGGGDRPRYGSDRPSYGSGDRPARSFGGDKPRYGSRDGGDKPFRSERPRFGGEDKPRYGSRDGGGDKPRYGSRDGGGDRPRFGSGDKPFRSERPRFGGEDKPGYGGGDKPRYGSRDGGGDRPRFDRGDRPPRSFGSDRPPRSFDRDKPRYDSRDGGGDRPRYGSRDGGRDFKSAPRSFEPTISPEVSKFLPLKHEKGRYREARFLIEGAKNISDVVAISPGIIHTVLVAQGFEDDKLKEALNRLRVHTQEVSPSDLKALCDTETPQGIVAVANLGAIKPDWAKANMVTLLDGIQDPGNVGAILRTSAALGVDAVVFGKGTCDPYNPKVVRASAASLLRVPIETGEDLGAKIQFLRLKGFSVVATSPHAPTTLPQVKLRRKVAILFGNEGAGVGINFLDQADALVRIPMQGKVESLNVAVAHGLMTYELLQLREKP